MPILRHVGRVSCQKNRLKKEYEYYEFTWVIKNFRNCYNDVGGYHESPEFWTGSKYSWTLDIFVGGYTQYAKEYIGLRVYLMNKDAYDNIPQFIVECAIIDDEGEENYNETVLLTSENLDCDSSVFKRFILKSDLLSDPSLLPENNLKIACKISFQSSSNFEVPHKSKKSVATQTSVETAQLNVLSKLLDDDEFSDFSFVVGEKKFHVHRAILAVSSPVFRAMFESEMLESKEGKVHIDDVEPDVMEKLLRFVYVGEADDLDGVADKVLIASEKYQIDSLKQLCEAFLVDRVNVDNVYYFLQLADKYNAIKLQNKTMEFFNANLKKLSVAEDFKASISLLPTNLQTDVICAMAKKL